jgi:hypothetical protein
MNCSVAIRTVVTTAVQLANLGATCVACSSPLDVRPKSAPRQSKAGKLARGTNPYATINASNWNVWNGIARGRQPDDWQIEGLASMEEAIFCGREKH